MPNLITRFLDRLLEPEVTRRVSLAVRALDDSTDRAYGQTEGVRDRYAYNRQEILQQCLDAWRENPLARRIVGLTSDYVIGGGIGIESAHPATHAFLDQWWNHPLNHMPIRTYDWCDELTRSGELFVVLSTDASGMSYVRAVPAADVAEIESAPNDVEQELSFKERPSDLVGEAKVWKAYDQARDALEFDSLGFGSFPPVMLHYAINRPVGAQRGESDLAPLLKWLTRYSAWLEDRVRLNRFRQVFIYWVHRAFNNEAERRARQAELNANPPNPGSILVTDDAEVWEVMSPKLDAFEAREDGMALKKTLCAGAGIPLHFLAEPESSTRTTAEQSGGPTFRHYDRRQQFYLWLIGDLARVAVRRRALADPSIDPEAAIQVTGTDISVRDNATLATAAKDIINSFLLLHDRGLIDDAELLRVTYRFAGEVVNVGELLQEAQAAPPIAPIPPAEGGALSASRGILTAAQRPKNGKEASHV